MFLRFSVLLHDTAESRDDEEKSRMSKRQHASPRGRVWVLAMVATDALAGISNLCRCGGLSVIVVGGF